jgi:hypothetical protein
MRNIIFFTAVFSLFSLFSFSQVNVGFAKAGGLEEAIACSTQAEALDRFIASLENKIIGPILFQRIVQSYENAGKDVQGSKVTYDYFLKVLKYFKKYPEDMSKYGVAIRRLPAGNYTLETLTFKNGSWVQGKEITRSARKDEWVLEQFDQKIASSWCLNLFGSVGEIQQPKDNVIIKKETVRIVRDTVYDYVDRTPKEEYGSAKRKNNQMVVVEQPCGCYRKIVPRWNSQRVTYVGYFLFPPGVIPMNTPWEAWEEKPLHMCKRYM